MGYREFSDERGRAWIAWDTYPQGTGYGTLPGYEHGWLSFEGGGEKRRLVPVPSGWDGLPDSALLRLLGSAERVRGRVGRLGAAEP